MKRERLNIYVFSGIVLVIFAFTGYSYFLSQQTAAILSHRQSVPAVERYSQLREAVQAAERKTPVSIDEVQMPEGYDNPTGVLEAIDRAQAVLAHAEGITADGTPWHALWAGLLQRSPATWSASDWAQLITFQEDNAGFLDEIRALSHEDGPVCLLDLSPEPETKITHLAPMRDIANMLRVSALLRARNGDTGGAVADLLAVARLAERLREEPLFISQIVRFGMERLAKETIEDAFPPGEIPLELVQGMAAQFNSLNLRDDFVQAWRFEQQSVLNNLSHLTTGSWIQSNREMRDFEANYGMGAVGLTGLLYTSPAGMPWRHLDVRDFAEAVMGLEDSLSLPYAEANVVLDQTINELPSTRYIAHRLLPFTRSWYERLAGAEAQQRLLLLGAAVETYADQHGTYPERIEDVYVHSSATSTIDPFSGAPFRYTVSGDTFRLYSVGRNLTDDGGNHNRTDGDLVWRGREE